MNASAGKDALVDLLRPERLTGIVDIGANPIDGEPPYMPMLSLGICAVTGFEPHPEALAHLNARKSVLETYLPYAIGHGGKAKLHICHASGMSSLLEPDPHALSHFPNFAEWGRVVREIEVTTRRLDDVTEIDALD